MSVLYKEQEEFDKRHPSFPASKETLAWAYPDGNIPGKAEREFVVAKLKKLKL